MVARVNPQMAHLVKDMGVLLEGIYEELKAATTYEAAETIVLEALDTEAYLGITRGGVAFSMESDSRIVEYDGRRVRSVGDFSIDNATPQFTTNVLLQHDANLRRIFPMCDVTVEGERYTLSPRLGSPKPEDYMSDLCLVRDFVGGAMKVDVLLNAINTASQSFTGADMSESEAPVTFIGTAATFADTEFAPYKLLKWEKA